AKTTTANNGAAIGHQRATGEEALADMRTLLQTGAAQL
ncbi:MAG: hypothetical protein ACJAY5_001936, partial [Actinomycetes bacterium]